MRGAEYAPWIAVAALAAFAGAPLLAKAHFASASDAKRRYWAVTYRWVYGLAALAALAALALPSLATVAWIAAFAGGLAITFFRGFRVPE